MKKLVLPLILLFSIEAVSQETAVFNKAWTSLKTQFIAKTEASTNIATLAMDSKNVTIASLEKLKGFAFALRKFLAMPGGPNKATIARISQINDSLDIHLSEIQQQLDADINFCPKLSYAEFKENLRTANTKLDVLKHDYNSACKETGKTDLAFPDEKHPKVSFD